MKIAVVDDNKKDRDLLASYINKFKDEKKIEITVVFFSNLHDFLKSYSHDYDLIIMDIEMPGLNGIETAKELRRMDSRVVLIFITNMIQYAINGYEVEAVDFVIKPITYGDFLIKIQKSLRYISRNTDKKITITTQDCVVNLYLSDICYIEVIRHYLVYHTVSGKYKVRGVMKKMEEELAEFNFVRSNHCYLINLKYVKPINGNTVKVLDDNLIISGNKKSDFLLSFTKYIGGIK